MKKYFFITIALVMSALTISAQSTKGGQPVKQEPKNEQNVKQEPKSGQTAKQDPKSGQPAKQDTKSVITFYIAKMECENCKKKITDKISYEKGVKDLVFDLSNRLITITYDAKKTTPETLKAFLAKIGYEASEPKVCPSTKKPCNPGCPGHKH